jgi:hypothetical protein
MVTKGIRYPDAARDTTRLQETSYVLPFNWITVTRDSGGRLDERKWSNLHLDALFRPVNYVSVSSRHEFDLEESHEEIRHFGITVTPADFFSVTFGQYRQRQVTDAVSLAFDWKFTEKWELVAGGQYDYEVKKFLEQKVTLRRDFHDFIVEAIVEVDSGRDERRYLIGITPKFLRSGTSMTRR